jgi:hypothetical protein
LLKSEDVEILGTKSQAGIRAKVVASSLVGGKVKIRGTDLNPDDMEFLASSEDEIAKFLNSANTVDSKMMTALVIRGAAAGAIGLGAIKGIYILVNGAAHPSSQSGSASTHDKK